MQRKTEKEIEKRREERKSMNGEWSTEEEDGLDGDGLKSLVGFYIRC